LLDYRFRYHGTKQVPGITHTETTEAKPFKEVISARFAEGYKRRIEDGELDLYGRVLDSYYRRIRSKETN
jgi:hypothetical protein